MNTKTIERFWSKVEKTPTCWNWTASKRAKGYGAFVWADESGAIIQGRAHRFSWEIINGPIPAGLCILHRCDNPRCVNPEHLFIGTKADNNADMLAKGRRVKGGVKCGSAGKWPRAEKHPNARLDWDSIALIRQDRDNGLSFSKISNKYNVTISTAYKICKNLSWKI